MEALHAIFPIVSIISIYVILCHWHMHWRIGLAGEVIGRAPMMFIWDAMAMFCAVNGILLAAHEASGHTLLSYQSAPKSSTETAFVSAACFLALFLIMKFNASDRFFEPTVAGIREGAVRTLLTLRVIDRIEDIAQKMGRRL